MTKPAADVHVTIDDVVVTGLRAGDARSVVDALRNELLASLARPHDLAPGAARSVESLRAVRVRTDGARAPRDLGNAAARAITTAVQQAGGR